MSRKLFFLSVPGLRDKDLALMPNLNEICSAARSRIAHSFPCVTWPSQANVLTGKLPAEHGVIANGFYWREKHEVEMWTAWNEVIEQPQIWDVLKQKNSSLKTAAWFPMLSKGCGADYVCMPAPIHKPDGSEDLWCYTKPQEFYGELLREFGHFPLQHFWGPLANIKSTQWIADSAMRAVEKFQPDFFYIYLPHLDYSAQKNGPDSPEATKAVEELDQLLGNFEKQIREVCNSEIEFVVASEYTIVPVNHVTHPNRILREHGFLKTKNIDGAEHLDLENSTAWAMVDHQFSHVFVSDRDENTIAKIADVFEACDGFDYVLKLDQRNDFGMNHERSGEIVLISTANSWQAYYWWMDDALAPSFARQVDIHRKPGYDPIELSFDMQTKSVPLDATLARGSHGAPVKSDEQKGVLLTSFEVEGNEEIQDTAIFDLVLNRFTG